MVMMPQDRHLRFGVVIGTYGSSAYIELGLACLRRHEPDLHVLVHDDGSPEGDRLNAICQRHGAEFFTHPMRYAPMVGDISAFVEGLKWARLRGCDVLVKFSRRWVVDKPWSSGLLDVVTGSGYATFSGTDAHREMGFRSECMALDVAAWVQSGTATRMEAAVAANTQFTTMAETWYHELARDVHDWLMPSPRGALISASERFFRRPFSWNAYGWWPLLGLSRAYPPAGVLWHDAASPEVYAALAQQYGLAYTVEDFTLAEGTF